MSEEQGTRRHGRVNVAPEAVPEDRTHEEPLAEKSRSANTQQTRSRSSAQTQQQTYQQHRPFEVIEASAPEECTVQPPSSTLDLQKRKRGITMPGSLFPRSPSLDPTPAPQKAEDRQVHFMARHDEVKLELPSAPTMNEIAEEPEEPPDLSQFPRPFEHDEGDNPFLPTGMTPALVERITSNTEDAKRFLEDFTASPRSSPIPDTPIPTRTAPPRRLLIESPIGPEAPVNVLPVLSVKAKGKQKATEPEEVYEEGNSKVLRVRGKERELLEVQEEHQQKEQDRADDPETTIILEERGRDKERIRELEAELVVLKRQVCRY
ncbi:uncharacterized protein PHACADRAFT_251723 [Phanerochaete carnosa HHB-10118-sp]|uniref:Uncharacterized protein n=1 Tax=Phanerochaete carnosa (strain HHB-10118-sp) TaxID=650164 RepID=K5WF09_PHACS|nr:uncharacterized protein PHACADRAFT_251723 [Phanerochaete carnosa HHB-10118-sp]EKM57845.1 hypothetical protein PHACADRAFT_251723 [Phanerochaete carnosa HHB-10118-sp]